MRAHDKDPSGGELWGVSAGARDETGAGGSSADLSGDATESKGSGAGRAAPFDGGRRHVAPGGGAEGAVSPYELGERCYALTERWRWSVLGLRDPDFSPVRKVRGPPTPRALLTPTSAGALCKDNRGPVDNEFVECEAVRGLALHLVPILGRGHIWAWRASTKGQCKHVLYEPLGRRAAERRSWDPGGKWSRGSSAGLPGDGEETLRCRNEEGQHRLRGPLDRGRGRTAPSGGAADAVGTCGLGVRRAVLRPSGGGRVLPGRTVRTTLGLPDPNFSLAKKSRGPQTSRTLLDPSSTEVRGTRHPGGALYKSNFTARPRLRYKLRTVGGAHRQAIGEDISLYARLGGAPLPTSSSSAKQSWA
ncbi:hypothetical protein NDU88_003659 [Pleurodeles waltl]|uniref:Uncharacterized protein n=1 Tax=Pleurodeles waltl TaxID=8319 RepID=A0AAV7RGV3_PLEWA|nr:hypothetical protein NDU88_003659 [Pleurodeles waltl]